MNNQNTQQTNGQTQQNGVNKGTYNNNVKPNTNYPRKRSSVSVVAGIIMILVGISYITNEYLPWIFVWLNPGLLIAIAAIIVGFALIIKK